VDGTFAAIKNLVVQSQLITYNDSRIQYLGRWNDTGSGKWTAWAGSQIKLQVCGTRKLYILLNSTDPSTTVQCLAESYIDNDSENSAIYDPVTYKAANSYNITDVPDIFSGNLYQVIDLPDTNSHSVTLFTSGAHVEMFNQTLKSTIKGFFVDYGGGIDTLVAGTNVLQTVGDSWMGPDTNWIRLCNSAKWNYYPVAHG
jgi:hypothetical protein